MKNLSIRKANPTDAQEISELLSLCQWFTYRHLFSNEYIEKLITNYYNVERISEEISFINLKWHGYFIAQMNFKIVGVIGGGMIDDTDAEVYVFYLDPCIRNMGIGTRLLDFYTKIQKHTYGATHQWISVAKGNHYGIPFYEARNFLFHHEELSYGATNNDEDYSLKYKRGI